MNRAQRDYQKTLISLEGMSPKEAYKAVRADKALKGYRSPTSEVKKQYRQLKRQAKQHLLTQRVYAIRRWEESVMTNNFDLHPFGRLFKHAFKFEAPKVQVEVPSESENS